MSVIRRTPVPQDVDIAQSANIQPISEIAARYGLEERFLEHYGNDKAKVRLEFLSEKRGPVKRAKYIDVTAITPTPLGEGKTTTTIGLAQGLGFIGKKSIATIRQPSMGPTFGIKGGAAGGGYSQIVPMTDFNLHLTGDIHAVSAAHNLCTAALDARIYHESRWSESYFEKLGIKKLNIDSYSILWRRVVDMNDRTLRKIVIGMGGLDNGPLREAGFDISVASEVMAVLALATSLEDLRKRLGRIVVALDRSGNAITTEDLGVAGAMTILMKDALKPNALQTLEEQLAFVHAGPFANIAHGNSSIVADLIATQIADYVITESGFGADMGFEKFMDIKCRASGIMPDAVVLVATVRALKMHGGGPKVVPGKSLPIAYTQENIELLRKGLSNLIAHIAVIKKYGLPVVVSINSFPTDTEAEHELIRTAALEAGAFDAVVSKGWALGGEGTADLALAVDKAVSVSHEAKLLYPLELSLKEKIEVIAREVYGAGSVTYTDDANEAIEKYTTLGYGNFPICMAKTQYSFSHDPTLKGAPKGFVFPVREVRLSAGAGFIVPITGDITTMPGLPSKPAFIGMDIDTKTGRITGLS
jgi:methylenetetrahydrofolate dehydrogenase (NADP+)/methenyltetrahydrofolate cyclohydrolase/formyltetrahydrofolate synthetase/formate--tetrahydrofolate ligase